MRQDAKELWWNALFLVVCSAVGTLTAVAGLVLVFVTAGWLL